MAQSAHLHPRAGGRCVLRLVDHDPAIGLQQRPDPERFLPGQHPRLLLNTIHSPCESLSHGLSFFLTRRASVSHTGCESSSHARAGSIVSKDENFFTPAWQSYLFPLDKHFSADYDF